MAKRLLQPRWIGAAILFLSVGTIVIFCSASSAVPCFPNATLVVSEGSGIELGSCGLQDPQAPYILPHGAALSIQMKSCEFDAKDKGTKIKLEWRLLESTAMADVYEFKIVAGANIIPIVKRIEASSETVELFKSEDFVVVVKGH